MMHSTDENVCLFPYSKGFAKLAYRTLKSSDQLINSLVPPQTILDS